MGIQDAKCIEREVSSMGSYISSTRFGSDHGLNRMDGQKSGTERRSISFYKLFFKPLGKLGEGGFGNVYRVEHKLDGRRYAVKIIPFSARALKDYKSSSVFREIQTFSRLEHPNICRYHATWVESDSPRQPKGGRRDNNNGMPTQQQQTTVFHHPRPTTPLHNNPQTKTKQQHQNANAQDKNKNQNKQNTNHFQSAGSRRKSDKVASFLNNNNNHSGKKKVLSADNHHKYHIDPENAWAKARAVNKSKGF